MTRDGTVEKAVCAGRSSWLRRKNTGPTLGRIYLVFAATIIAGIVLGHWLVPWGPVSGPGWAGHLLRWDGLWYRDIAMHGYHWQSHERTALQNVAFFPLYPMIEAGLMRMVGPNIWLTSIMPGALFGLWSIAAFARLAETIWGDRQSALQAAMLYALWPASSFYFNGYPTGLINLCAIAAIQAMLNQHKLRSAFWCGLGAAAAPTMVFFAAGLCLTRAYQWWRDGCRLAELARLILFCVLIVCGLLLLMAFFGWRFGDPLLFVVAQNAWGVNASFIDRFILLADPVWYFYPFVQTFALWHQTSLHTLLTSWRLRTIIVKLIQKDVDVIAIAAIIAALIASWRTAIPLSLRLTALTCLIGYLWYFVAIYTPFFNGVRLLFPVLLLFLVSPKMITYKFMMRVVCVTSGAILIGYVGSIYAGYPVI